MLLALLVFLRKRHKYIPQAVGVVAVFRDKLHQPPPPPPELRAAAAAVLA